MEERNLYDDECLVDEDERFKYYEATINGRVVRYTEDKLETSSKISHQFLFKLIEVIKSPPN